MNIDKLRSALAAICLLFAACVKDKPNVPNGGSEPASGRQLLIANEGSLGNGNASLSVYKLETDSIYNDIFFQKNGSHLGDVFQSIFVDGAQMYLAVNNSDKLTVLNSDNFSLIRDIPVTKPRYMAKTGENKLYVTCLFYPKISIVNTKTGVEERTIVTDFPNTEGILATQNSVYACNWDTACNYLYEIDPSSDAITHRIPVAGYAPNQVMEDKNGDLWVLAGNVYKGKAASLTVLDPQTRLIKKSFTFPSGADIIKPAWNPTRDTLYYLGVDYEGGTKYNGVYRLSIEATSLPETLFIQASRFQYFWALGVDATTNKIYVGDPKGFIQKGSVLVYNTSGSLLHSFTAGIGPGFFYFR